MENDLSTAAEFAKRFATEAACRDYLIQSALAARLSLSALRRPRFFPRLFQERPHGGRQIEQRIGQRLVRHRRESDCLRLRACAGDVLDSHQRSSEALILLKQQRGYDRRR
jgi:hypothetical protein